MVLWLVLCLLLVPPVPCRRGEEDRQEHRRQEHRRKHKLQEQEELRQEELRQEELRQEEYEDYEYEYQQQEETQGRWPVQVTSSNFFTSCSCTNSSHSSSFCLLICLNLCLFQGDNSETKPRRNKLLIIVVDG